MQQREERHGEQNGYIEYHASDAVGTEQIFVGAFLSHAVYYIEDHADEDYYDAEQYCCTEHISGVAAVAYRIYGKNGERHELFAEELVKEHAERHGRGSDAGHDAAERLAGLMPEQQPERADDGALAEVGEHDAVDERICQRHKGRGVDLVIYRQTVHADEKLERAENTAVDELCRGRNSRGLAGVLNYAVDVWELLETFRESGDAFFRHPTEDVEVVIAFDGVPAYVEGIMQVAQL